MTIQACTDIHQSVGHMNHCVHMNSYAGSLVHICHLGIYYHKVYLDQQIKYYIYNIYFVASQNNLNGWPFIWFAENVFKR